MKKIIYFTDSPDQIDNLPDTQISIMSLGSKLSLQGIENNSVMIIANQSDFAAADRLLSNKLLSNLKKVNQPILLLNDSPQFVDLGRSEQIQSGIIGSVTKETFQSCFDRLIILETIDTDYDWEIVLSLTSTFAQATCEVLETTADARAKVLGFVVGQMVPPDGELISSMSLRGDFCGEVLAIFTKAQAKKIAVEIARCSESEIKDSDLVDGVQELINQISGRLRSLEWSNSCQFSIDLPSVSNLINDNHTFDHSSGWITILIECHGQICTLSIKAGKVSNRETVSKKILCSK